MNRSVLSLWIGLIAVSASAQVADVAPMTNADIIAAAASDNKELDAFVQGSELTGASDGLKQTLRTVSGALNEATAGIQKSYGDVKDLEAKLAESGDVKAASQGLVDAFFSMIGGTPEVLDLLPYKAELDAIKDKQPYSNARAAHLALGVNLRNFQRTLAELKKELTVLSLQVNAKAKLVGTEGVSDDTLKTLDYSAAMDSTKDEWAGFTDRLAQSKDGAPAEFQDTMAKLQQLSVYSLPKSQ